jgi:FAD:protein FMN transferase
MGTGILACVDNGSDQPPAELMDVPVWFEEWEQSLSRFRTDSELSRVNRAGSQPMPVSSVLWEVFQSALVAEKFTDGLVTPTVLDAMLGAGYSSDFASLPRQQDAPIGTQSTVRPLNLVQWDPAAHTLQLPADIHLDFGGIAKGWAAGQAVSRLQEVGSVLMNCGGDIAISGPLLDGSPWEIGVYKPFDREGEYAEMLFFGQGCGVASSATDRRRWLQGNQIRHHIIDPRTGMPAQSDVLSATVVAPTAVEAEAAAKSILIQGSLDGLNWLEANPALAGLLILEDGQVLYSQKIIEYL